MTRTRTVAGAAAAALTSVGLLTALPAAAADDITVDWQVSDSWSTGATVTATLTNHSSAALNPWKVTLAGGGTVSSAWNATQNANTFSAPSWAPTLAPGQSVTFGLSTSSPQTPTGCVVTGHTCTVHGASTPTPTPTQTTQTPTPTPTQTQTPAPIPTSDGATGLPRPIRFTPTSTASGTVRYHLNLPYGSGNVETMTLSANYTDLIASNFVAGAVLGRMLNEKDPSLQFNKDYVYGSVFAQLLQENINTGGYTNNSDWISPTAGQRAQLLAVGQGGPYQINDYSKRLENDTGVGLVNFTTLQKGLGFTVEKQDSGAQTLTTGPDSLDQKYFGPMAAAYFHLNDYNRIAMNNAESWGPQAAHYNKCMTNLRDPRSASQPNNMYDLMLNAAYNAGTYSAILKDYFRICAGMYDNATAANQVKSVGDYTLSDTGYQSAIGTTESAGSTFILYPRQIRVYLDQLYNQKTFNSSAITGDTVINLSAQDVSYVFSNAMGTLAYVDASGEYRYIDPADSAAAYASALSATGQTMSSFMNISTPAGKAKFFSLLEHAVAGLGDRLHITFSDVTQTTIGAPHSPTPTATPTPTPTPTPTATPTAPVPAPKNGVSVKMVNASDWGSGRTMNTVVTNLTGAAVSSWSIAFAWPSDIAPWSAKRLSYVGGNVTVGNESWNGALSAGTAATFGFSDGSASQPKPTTCTATVNGTSVACTITN